MTAARGIIHSEMPQQTQGRMRGFQLWLNLPSTEKMKAASYRDIPAAQIPRIALSQGGEARLIAGTLHFGGQTTEGAVEGAKLTTDPFYFDVRLPPGAEFTAPIPAAHSAFVYVYEGSVEIGEAKAPLPHRAAGVLSSGDRVSARAGKLGAQFLLLAAKPLREPVVQYGPFVMNTREEIEQAIADYREGRLATAA
jgi:hypothetical protein